VTAAPLLVLIGPAAAGKSTVGALVADRLGVPFVDLDAVAAPAYAEVGWSVTRLTTRIAAVGRLAAEVEWEPARAHAVARVVAEHPGAVVALGAGHTTYTSAVHAAAVRAALAPVRAVVLLLPAEAPEEALAVLRARSLADKGTDWVRDGHDFLAGWVADPAVRALATHVVVTGDEPPGRTAERLARLVRPEG
jgi:shikimate kinase